MIRTRRSAAPVDGEAPARRKRRRSPWWELPVLVLVAIAAAALLKTFVVQPYSIPSGSMERTLHGCDRCSGDRILTFKPVFSVDRDPHPGDIVVFRDPGGWDPLPLKPLPSNPVLHGLTWLGQFVGLVPPHEKDLVKRVVAVGGQTVKCCDAQGNVEVGNGGPGGPFRSLDDASYTYLSTGVAGAGRQPFGPVTVPTGRLWVMGDHRDGSADSRAHCGSAPDANGDICSDGTAATASASTVPLSNVLGKAVVIAWPPSRWTTLGTPSTFTKVPLPSSEPAWPDLPTSSVPLALGAVAAAGVRSARRRR